METPCTFNIYRTWNPTNVEEASSMIYLPVSYTHLTLPTILLV